MATGGAEGLVSYMVVGKTGVGKSSLINSVAGEEVAEEGEELDIGTYDLESYEVTHETTGNTIRFWDTPGLFDITKRSESYMEKIREKYKECDLVLYCSNMTDTRVTEQDKRTIRTFTEALGEAFWQRTCFIFTFGNDVQDPRSRDTTAKYFTDTLQRLKDAYGKVLKESGVSAKVVEKIPFIPAGYHPWSEDPEMYVLPDGKHWTSVFWLSCFARVKDAQKVPRTVPSKKPQQGAKSQEAKPGAQPAIPTREQCTFNKHQRTYIKQDWFECHTCWGGDSGFGCCWPCALDCHRGHQLVKHHTPEQGSFFCDCGLNKHQPAVCTFYNTREEQQVPQPFYECHSCFSIKSAGVCHQCMINCHRGHRIDYAGVLPGFCDCGLPYCRVNCCIAEPK